MSERSPLKWKEKKEMIKDTWPSNQLFAAYQPGHPLMFAEFRTGHGFVDVRTGFSINPTKLAYINPPD